jgi:hypothetical protein
VEVIKWNTQEDAFEHGQWLHGRIYEERCGVSPNGSLFVYFALKYGKVATKQGYEQTYTAVSRPPFLTALALWPTGSTWGGGGRFMDNQTLRLAYGKDGTYHPGVGPTECHRFEANQFRLFLHSAAYVLLDTLRREVFKGTSWACATMETIQLRILKLGARVQEFTHRIKISLPSSCPVALVVRQSLTLLACVRLT